MIVSSKKILQKAQQGKYAVGAFNVENMEMMIAVIEAAQACNAPLIIQTTPSTIRYASLDLFYAMFEVLAKPISIPVALHLDHGNDFNLCMQALHSGYTSIMIDKSKENIEKNIEITRKVVDVASACKISVEAEIGQIGGKEDGEENHNAKYTSPSDAAYFAKASGCDSLAVAIGSAHGIYKQNPDIKIQVLEEIRKVVDIPLVLHGTSGIPDDIVAACVAKGICKVNYATDLRIAYSEATRKVLQDPKVIDPKEYGKLAQANIKKYVTSKLKILGCINQG